MHTPSLPPTQRTRRDGGGEHMTRKERADLERVNKASKEAGYNPFAKFFDKETEADKSGS